MHRADPLPCRSSRRTILNERSVNGRRGSMDQPTRRAAQARGRRAQLLDAALALFAAQGFERATIKDLSEAAGVAQGLVYHYFRGKDELALRRLPAPVGLPRLHHRRGEAPPNLPVAD